MSSDGKQRKSTMAWGNDGSSGGEAGAGNRVVVIEESSPEPAPITETEAYAAQAEPPRTRKNTLERFNDEMAVLERPLESDVEYVDEKPPRRWGKAFAFAATVAVVGIGGSLLISHHRAAVAARVEPTPSPAVAAASPVAVASPPVAALQPSGAAASPAAPSAQPAPAGETVEDDDAAADADVAAAEGSAWKAPPRTAWTKVHTKVTRSKHARTGGGKTVYRRTTTTTRHHVVVKRTTSGRR